MSTYTVRYGQSLIDVSIQCYGTIEALFDLCLDNNLEIDDDLITGLQLTIRDTLPDTADPDIVSYFIKKGIIVSSGISGSAQIFEQQFEQQFE